MLLTKNLSSFAKLSCLAATFVGILSLSSTAIAGATHAVPVCISPLQTNFAYYSGSSTNYLTVKYVSGTMNGLIINPVSYFNVFNNTPSGVICPASAIFTAQDNRATTQSPSWTMYADVPMQISITTPVYRQYVNGKAVNKNFFCQFINAPITMSVINIMNGNYSFIPKGGANSVVKIDGRSMTCTLTTNAGSRTVNFSWQ